MNILFRQIQVSWDATLCSSIKQRHNPHDLNLQQYGCGNLKSRSFSFRKTKHYTNNSLYENVLNYTN
jgi:hypothetical protein